MNAGEDLGQQLERIAVAALAWAAAEETIVAVIPAEPDPGRLVFLVAFETLGSPDPPRTWIALDSAAQPVAEWAAVRDAVSIAAMCEAAEEVAGGGNLDELRSQLVGVRLIENPPGIDEAIEAVGALERALGRPPRIAMSVSRLTVSLRMAPSSGLIGCARPRIASMKFCAWERVRISRISFSPTSWVCSDRSLA